LATFLEPLSFANRAEWRAWLHANHQVALEAWLVLFKARYRQGRMTLEEAVEEALCYGWIDGKLRSLDETRFALRFTPRRPDSVWSARNIARVGELERQGLMTEAGRRKVAQAHQSRQWAAALARERPDEIPEDLARALRRKKGALAGYRQLPDSRKKQLLHWLESAKRAETRKKRLNAIVEETTAR
jgi:uncharacterized protein YdeI (YjbR/CyaY-like superfamily)